jgi:membrane protease YdiL (CAAX protease family)
MALHKPDSRLHNVITGVLISGLLFLRLVIHTNIILMVFDGVNYSDPVYQIGTYLLTAIIIWWERDFLGEFFIDKIALAILIVGKPIELIILTFRVGINPLYHHNYYLLYLPIAIGLLLTALFSRSKLQPIQGKNCLWLFAAIPIGIVVGYLFGYLLRLFPNFSGVSPKFDPILLLILPVTQLVRAGIAEEPLFRGFLWGYLRRLGWKDGWILVFQMGLFWVAHIYYFSRAPISFWLIIPSGGLILGLLAWKSRSISTSMVAHGFSNAFGDLFGHFSF